MQLKNVSIYYEDKDGNVKSIPTGDVTVTFPESSFKNVLEEMEKLHDSKNADYGDCFSTCFKTFGEAYAFGHIMEKVERLKSLYKNEKLNNESVRDSLIDCASYCVMTIVELDNAKSNEHNNPD